MSDTIRIGEKSCLKKCEDCGKFFHYLEGGRWCEECFDIGLAKDMNEHFDNFLKEEMKELKEGDL